MTRLIIVSIATLSSLTIPAVAQDSIRFLKAGSGLGQLNVAVEEQAPDVATNNYGFANVRPTASQNSNVSSREDERPKLRIVPLKKTSSY